MIRNGHNRRLITTPRPAPGHHEGRLRSVLSRTFTRACGCRMHLPAMMTLMTPAAATVGGYMATHHQ
jgi:hypothetical protein